MDPETQKHRTDCGISEGRQGSVGGWEVINQRTCMHICITHGYRQYGGEGLGLGGGGESRQAARRDQLGDGGNGTNVILSTIKI